MPNPETNKKHDGAMNASQATSEASHRPHSEDDRSNCSDIWQLSAAIDALPRYAKVADRFYFDENTVSLLAPGLTVPDKLGQSQNLNRCGWWG